MDLLVTTAAQRPDLLSVMLAAMRRNAGDQGYADLVAPVRPSAEHRHHDAPIAATTACPSTRVSAGRFGRGDVRAAPQ